MSSLDEDSVDKSKRKFIKHVVPKKQSIIQEKAKKSTLEFNKKAK